MVKKIVLGTKCSLCKKKTSVYTDVLSITSYYRLCDRCKVHYDSLDNSGKKWIEKEQMEEICPTSEYV
jgi:hypothetical protein